MPATWLNELLVMFPNPAWLLVAPGVWITIVLAVLAAIVLRQTVFGRRVFALGSNEAAARACGIATDRLKIWIYGLAGLLFGLAGVMQMSRLRQGDPTVAAGSELDIIAAVVIGGGSLNGGEGSILGSMIGALIMAFLRNGCASRLAQLRAGDHHRHDHRRCSSSGSLAHTELIMIKLIVCSLLLLSVAQAQTADCKNDWPNLARYDKDNKTVAPPAKNEQRVVFMGDSITDSWDSPNNGGFFSGRPYVNRGISGQTTPQMLIRFRRDVIELKPKVVVILAGTNDIAGNTGPTTLEAIQDNLKSMAEARGSQTASASCLLQSCRSATTRFATVSSWSKQFVARPIRSSRSTSGYRSLPGPIITCTSITSRRRSTRRAEKTS